MTVSARGCQRIVGGLEDRLSVGEKPVKAKEISAELGSEVMPVKAEGVRSKTRRRAERARLLLEGSGMFSGGRRPAAGGPWPCQASAHV